MRLTPSKALQPSRRRHGASTETQSRQPGMRAACPALLLVRHGLVSTASPPGTVKDIAILTEMAFTFLLARSSRRLHRADSGVAAYHDSGVTAYKQACRSRGPRAMLALAQSAVARTCR